MGAKVLGWKGVEGTKVTTLGAAESLGRKEIKTRKEESWRPERVHKFPR